MSPQSATFQSARSAFPPDFIFGCATAAYQIEGGGDSRGRTIWDTFAATPGNVRNREDGATACDHLSQYEHDLALLRDLGFAAYRFSFSWPRLFPGAETASAAGFDFYDRLIDTQLNLGLQPFATLYHWDLPSEIQDVGGWMNRETVYRFADYAGAVGARFGDRLASIATFNEPWCITYLSHMLGVHAPGYRDRRATARAMHHVPLAHGLATQALRAEGAHNIGLVLNMEATVGADDQPASAEAARRWGRLYQDWFLSGLFQGAYPSEVVDAFGVDLPKDFAADLATIAAPLDWLGINYYTQTQWQSHGQDFFDLTPLPWPERSDPPLTSTGWRVYPRGLTDFLVRTARDYTGALPLYVTENGMACPGTHDPQRIAYFDAHLGACLRALDQGVPLKGYFAWSLLDNYEWAEGYAQRFGLVHVDYDTQARTPKASAYAWQRFLMDS